MRVAFVGCGYVADFYMATLPNHPDLEVAGVMDRDPERAAAFASHYNLRQYETIAELLADETVPLVINLTNPHEHYAVSQSALHAGKHVYTEKPLAMTFEQSLSLVELAESNGLLIAAAPCNLLGESAQTLWRELRANLLGNVYLAYAELDDGLLHRMRYREWISPSGKAWPWKDELEVGCTIEHAAYYVTWLTAFFGPAIEVTSFAATLVEDKQTDEPLDVISPDFTSATIHFASGTVARITTSIVAPTDRSLRIIGEQGILSVEDCWEYGSPVLFRPTPLHRRVEEIPIVRNLLGLAPTKVPLARKATHVGHGMDFFRGVADLAAAIEEKRMPYMTPRHALHVNEIVLTIQNPRQMGCPRKIETTFEPLQPLPWAR